MVASNPQCSIVRILHYAQTHGRCVCERLYIPYCSGTVHRLHWECALTDPHICIHARIELKEEVSKKRNSLNSTTSHHDECKTLTKSIHIWCDSQTVTSIQKMHTQPMIIMFVCAYVCVWIYTYGINVASRYYKLCCLIPVLRCTACANLNLAMQITHLL